MNRVLLYIVAAVLAGCGGPANDECHPETDLITATIVKNDTGIVLTILKGHATLYRENISDAPISEAHVEDRFLDFDGDGQGEVVVYLWEGQNSGDRVFVFGEETGTWSQWIDACRPNFESEFVRIDGRECLRVLDSETGKMRTITCATRPSDKSNRPVPPSGERLNRR